MCLSSLSCRLALLAGLLLAAGGCGDSATARVAPVRGKVFYQGRPLTTGTIVFAPDAVRGTNGPLALGDIQADGSYALRHGEEFGAVVGWHRVTVSAVEAGQPAKAGQDFVLPRSLLPEKYRDPELSGLVREVKASQENTIDFHLD